MAHPPHFDPDDVVLAKLRTICLALPAADEKVSHGRPAFFTKKIFAIYGAHAHGPDAQSYEQSLVFQPDDQEGPALEQHPAVFTPKYWGPYGWLGYDLSSSPDWDEVAELVEESFRLTANKTRVKALDAMGSG